MKKINKYAILCVAVLAIFSAKAKSNNYYLGADISGTTMMEARNTLLYNRNNEPRENTVLMKELGLNAVRLRVWVEPQGGFCNKEDVLKMALRAKENGMAVMIDFHYSDSWADPGKQPIPKSWQGMTYKEMKRALAQHTTQTLKLLKNNGVDVAWVQIGNETTNGMLWETGRAETNMEQYAGLTDAGYAAVKRVYPNAKCIVHLDCGCDIKRYHRIFDGLKQYNARFDMIGMSVYPYWDMKAKRVKHENETIERVVANIKSLKLQYGKDVMIVETGYESARPNEGYLFMRKLIDATKALPECRGIFYWAPEMEHFYPLGAFANHRPTKILDAFTEAANGTEMQDTTFFSTRDLYCQSPNGKIWGRIYLPYVSEYSNQGKLPIVIMAHGFGSSFNEHLRYAECLAKHGIAAYIFDFCGGGMHSRSEGKTTDMSIFTEQADLEAITRTIKRLPNIDTHRVMLAGGSQGGLVASITAAANPADYKSLILLYPAFVIPETARNMLEKTKETPDEFMFGDMKLSQKYYLPLVDYDPYKAIGKYTHPVLVVYGDKDLVTPAPSIEKVKQAYSDVKFNLIPNGNHGFPDAFNHRLAENHILDFVRQTLKTP